MSSTSADSPWRTLKTLSGAVLFALTLGTAVVGITLYVSAPTREEFDRERERTRATIDVIKSDVTAVKMEQSSISSSVRGVDAGLRRVEESQRRVEDKLDNAIETRRER